MVATETSIWILETSRFEQRMKLYWKSFLINIVLCEKSCSGPKWKCRYDDWECKSNGGFKKFECDEGEVKNFQYSTIEYFHEKPLFTRFWDHFCNNILRPDQNGITTLLFTDGKCTRCPTDSVNFCKDNYFLRKVFNHNEFCLKITRNQNF